MFTEAKRRREKTYVIVTRTLRAATKQYRGFRFDGESTRATRKSIVLYHDKLYVRFCEIELRLLIHANKFVLSRLLNITNKQKKFYLNFASFPLTIIIIHQRDSLTCFRPFAKMQCLFKLI